MNSAQIVCVQTRSYYPPILATSVESFRLTSLLGYAATLADNVVATDPASVDADYASTASVLRPKQPYQRTPSKHSGA
jgi:hypothetical protein